MAVTIGRMLRFIFIGIGVIFPLVIQVIVFTVRACLVAIASLWVGVPTACRNVADDFLNKARDMGFPSLYGSYLYNILCVVTFFVIVGCWIIFAHVTVFFFGLIF